MLLSIVSCVCLILMGIKVSVLYYSLQYTIFYNTTIFTFCFFSTRILALVQRIAQIVANMNVIP